MYYRKYGEAKKGKLGFNGSLYKKVNIIKAAEIIRGITKFKKAIVGIRKIGLL